MPTTRLSISLPAAEAAVLLVLLPASVSGMSQTGEAVSSAVLDALQLQLGTAIRVLRINESSHPSVVSSFHAADLPCFVLVHHGTELWRQCGLSDGAGIAPLLLSKLSSPSPETLPQT